MCDNKELKTCMECGRYLLCEVHGYKDKPIENIIVCMIGGTKKWEYVNGKHNLIGGK